MPAYNAARYIEKAILSLQRQSHEDWQLIVADDASTDNTTEIVERFAARDSRIKLLTSNENSGSAYTPRKRAILAAETKWVMTLDADDWIDPQYIERLIERQHSANADIVWPVMYATPPGSRLVPTREYTRRDTIFKAPELILHTLPEWKISAAGGLVKKSIYTKAFQEVEKHFDIKNIFSDEAVTRALLQFADKAAFEETIYYYRMHPQSVTHAALDKKWHNYLTFGLQQIQYFKTKSGCDSELHRAAQTWLFHNRFDALQQLPGKTISQKKWKQLSKQIRHNIDLKQIAGNTSPKYRLLWQLPDSVIRMVLKLKKLRNSQSN